MLGTHGRSLTRAIFSPPARVLAKLGIGPNHVTIVGTVITVILAITVLARGYWAAGGISLGVVLFADSLDGTLARYTGKTSTFGAFLDSTLDRVGDGAVFSALVYSIATREDLGNYHNWLLTAALITLVGSATVPYARARAEAIGATGKGGIAERTDRLVIALVGCGLTDFGLPLWVAAAALTWVAFAATFTTFQRIFTTHRELQQQVDGDAA